MAAPEVRPRKYLVAFMHRPERSAPRYETLEWTEVAYTAEDAVTQLRVRCQSFLELTIRSVRPDVEM